MPTSLPPRTAKKQASHLSAVMFTLLATMLTLLVALFEMNPTDGHNGKDLGFPLVPSVNQSPGSFYD